MQKEFLKGKDIKDIRTLNTMYADGKLQVQDNDGNFYRLPVEVILKMVKTYEFLIEKKRVYNHLVDCRINYLK